MKKFTIILFFLIFPFFTLGEPLRCKYLHDIQEKFLNSHVLFSTLTPVLQKRTVEQFIKLVDPNKIYFLQKDVASIKSHTKQLFSNLKKSRCGTLYFIYDLYIKRLKSQIVFAESYLNNNFKLVKTSSFDVDSDNRKHPASTKKAEKLMKSYVQYQAANIYLIEKDLQKTIDYILQNLSTIKTRALSWKPHLTGREKRICQKDFKLRKFKTCKPNKWFSYYLKSFSQALDSHSSYLDSDDLEEFKINMELSLEGIGATLGSRFGYTVVERLVSGGAAAKSQQIKLKDKILAVGQSKKNMVNIFGVDLQDVVSMIRGKKEPLFISS